MSKTLTKDQLDQYNRDWGNLDLDDTERLLKIADLIEGNDINEAYAELEEFLAERGYNENPISGLN